MNYKACKNQINYCETGIKNCINTQTKRTEEFQQEMSFYKKEKEVYEHFANLCKQCGCDICMSNDE